MRRALLASIVGLVLVVGVGAHEASADRAAAEFFSQRGEKATREKDWTGAQTAYRKALEEDATFLPAQLGLAESLLGAGDKGAGVEELRKMIEAADALSPVPPAWVAAVSKARKRLTEVDAAGAQLDQIADKYVADLLASTDRWLVKDPDGAGLSLREAARVRPDHPRVKALLDKLAKADAAAWTQLFNGKDKAGWLWLDASEWGVIQGNLVGNSPNRALLAKSQLSFRGDFDVRMEMRVVEKFKDSMFVLMAAVKADARCSAFGLMGDLIGWEEEFDPSRHETKWNSRPSELPKPVDVMQWVTYEMRFRGNQCFAVINGDVVATLPRDPDRNDGAIGLRLQGVKVQVRKVEARTR